MFSPSLTLNKQPNRYLGLVALGCGFFMVLLDSTVLNVALPAIGQTLKSSLEGLQWIVNSYTLLFASLLLMGGTFADRYGARRVFCLGLVIFLCSSLLCSFAISLQMLIGARVLQGIGAAILLPASLSSLLCATTSPAIPAALLPRSCGDYQGTRTQSIKGCMTKDYRIHAARIISAGAIAAA